MQEATINIALRIEIFDLIREQIKDTYLESEIPWVVGFSGGKDSTLLLQLIWSAIKGIKSAKRTKHIFVLASDTRVETPDISIRVKDELQNIQIAASDQQLPITTHLVYPKLNDTFWVNLIGRGYPSPNNHFRWCTDRLKIYPVNDFIQKVIAKTGEVIILLGARKSESASRAQTMESYTLAKNKFRPHSSLRKAWVYTPIENLSTNEVWTYLLQVHSPWGGDNKGMITLYKNANGECPLVIDKSTPSCGQSRFGCWACTVIDDDKSISSLIDKGQEELEPLFELRKWLKNIRDMKGWRYDYRRNGTIPYRRGTDRTERLINTGPFRHERRLEILTKVLEAQKESRLLLIDSDELAIIQEIWDREEYNHPEKPVIPTDAVNRAWRHVYDGGAMPTLETNYDHLSREDEILKKVCEEKDFPFESLIQLRKLEEEYGHLRRRVGLPEEMREVFKQKFESEEE